MNKCFNQGNILAPIYLSGECPGAEEVAVTVGTNKNFRGVPDKAIISVPFVGPSGRLLRRMMRWANIEEGDYILSNAVPYRTTKIGQGGKLRNRRPTEEEITAELPRVMEELRRIRPKLIITIGKVPLWQLIVRNDISSLDAMAISDYVGHVVKLKVEGSDEGGVVVPEFEIPVLPLFHTSYLLRFADDDSRTRSDPYKITGNAINRNREYIEYALGRPVIINMAENKGGIG